MSGFFATRRPTNQAVFTGTGSRDPVAGSTGASVWSGPTLAQLRPYHADDRHDQQRGQAASDDRQRRTEERRGRAALEGAELVREADEDEIDRRHASAQVVRRDRLLERDADHDAHVVEDAGEEEAGERQRRTTATARSRASRGRSRPRRAAASGPAASTAAAAS